MTYMMKTSKIQSKDSTVRPIRGICWTQGKIGNWIFHPYGPPQPTTIYKNCTRKILPPISIYYKEIYSLSKEKKYQGELGIPLKIHPQYITTSRLYSKANLFKLRSLRLATIKSSLYEPRVSVTNLDKMWGIGIMEWPKRISKDQDNICRHQE